MLVNMEGKYGSWSASVCGRWTVWEVYMEQGRRQGRGVTLTLYSPMSASQFLHPKVS